MSIVIMYSYVLSTIFIEHIVEMVQAAEPFAGNYQLKEFVQTYRFFF